MSAIDPGVVGAIVMIGFYVPGAVGMFIAIRSSRPFQQTAGKSRFIIAALAAIIWPAVLVGILVEGVMSMSLLERFGA